MCCGGSYRGTWCCAKPVSGSSGRFEFSLVLREPEVVCESASILQGNVQQRPRTGSRESSLWCAAQSRITLHVQKFAVQPQICRERLLYDPHRTPMFGSAVLAVRLSLSSPLIQQLLAYFHRAHHLKYSSRSVWRCSPRCENLQTQRLLHDGSITPPLASSAEQNNRPGFFFFPPMSFFSRVADSCSSLCCIGGGGFQQTLYLGQRGGGA